MSEDIGSNLIAGARSKAGTHTLKSVDASTNEELPFTFWSATLDEVDAGARAAETAFSTYSRESATRRESFLDAIATEIDALDERFIEIVCRETALPPTRIRSERSRTSNQLRLFARVLKRGDFYGVRIDQAMPNREPAPRPDLRQYRIGVGPVAVFGASNFPLAFSTAGGDTAAALAAGCPVVFKAHSGHMVTTAFVASAVIRAAERTDMPAGVFNVIFGDDMGGPLVKHPAIRAVAFTGSLKGGRALCDMAAARHQPIPVFAEMSSINPVIVLPDALRNRSEDIVSDLLASVVLGCGQFCTKPGLVIGLQSIEFSAFIARLSERLGGQSAQTMLNVRTLGNYVRGLSHLSAQKGVTHLAGKTQSGRMAQPQLYKAEFSDLLSNDELLQEEIFGPALVVLEVKGIEELTQALQRLRGQLTATLIADAEDFAPFAPLIPLLEQKAGRLLINAYPTGVEVCDAIVHGGPFPATSDSRGTSVGTLAIDRFLRPVCFQNYPDGLLPEALKNANPLGLNRLIDGELTRSALTDN